MNKQDKILVAIAIIIFTIEGFFVFRCENKPVERIEYVDRVITRVDTIEVLKPVEIVKERRIVDTMLIPMVDTLRIRDTMYVEVGREQRIYQDSTYRAVVSGYQPRLESIEVYQRTQYVYRTQYERTRWGIGLQVGYGLGLDGKVVRSIPYIGVGLSYNLFSW